MLRSREGSTARLLQLCAGYFTFYVIFSLATKYFIGRPDPEIPSTANLPAMGGIAYLVYSTMSSATVCLVVIFVCRWYRMESNRRISIGPLKVPGELLYIVPSGLCTAVIIPTTTLMYTLPISVMVAMVIMRGSVIIISRIVDAIQIRQGILKKTVYWQENMAVAFAVLAVSTLVVYPRFREGAEMPVDFLKDPAALAILSSYIVAYSIRIYIFNYFKNTRAPGIKQDNKGFFGAEQISASLFVILFGLAIYHSPTWLGIGEEGLIQQVRDFRSAFDGEMMHPRWKYALLGGAPFGLVAFFSVFLFMFKGRTATFAGLVNRLTSLMAGTLATVLFAVIWNPKKFPGEKDWASLFFILVAVGFLTVAEMRRARELAALDSTEGDA